MHMTAAARWETLRDANVVRRAEEFAKFTLPYLMRDPSLQQQDIEHDFQSVGALLTNNLAAKLVQSLFPTGIPFFKSQVSQRVQMAAASRELETGQLTGILAQIDRAATDRLFLNASLAKLTRVVKLLIVTGTALLYRDSANASIVCWNLHSFVCRRTPHGHTAEIVIKQRFSKRDLKPEYIQALMAAGKNIHRDAVVDLYTVVERVAGTAMPFMQVWHEIDGVRVGDDGQFPEHLCPYICPTWNLADGEHYGRGQVEDFVGDFAKLSLVSEKLGLYELESLDILNLVNEAGGAVVDDYQEADTGDYVPGSAEAVTAYERGDYNKIAAVRESIGEVITRLSMAFMYTGNVRDAERVTAEEIRQTASEAESTLGGVYSLLAEGLQAPLAYVCMSEVSPDLHQGLIEKSHKPQILTGIPALSRSTGVQNLLNATQVLATTVPVLTQLDSRFDPAKITDMILAAYSVDPLEVFKSPEQLEAEARAATARADAADAASDALIQNAGEVQNSIQGLQA